jgi:hypothetical protein
VKREKTGGRKKGTPNKVTSDVRSAIALLAQRNIGKLEEWLKRVAADDPAKASDLLLRAIEYHIPKLSRAEVTGDGGGPLQVQIVRYGSDQTSE